MTELGPDPLARIPGETRRSNQALRDYAAMGVGRSQAALWERYCQEQAKNPLVKPPTIRAKTIAGWSKKYHWVARVADYDADLQQQARIAQIDAVVEMNQRHANLARAMMGIVARRLQALDPEELSPRDVARWAEACSKLERLAMGEATNRVDVIRRVRELSRQLGLPPSEEAAAVAEAEKIVREGA